MRRARETPNAEQIGFLLVNETQILTGYESAVLWRGQRGRGRVTAVLGLPKPEPHAPFTAWANALARRIAREHGDPDTPIALTADNVGGHAAEEWASYFPAHALWLPLAGRKGWRLGGLLLGRSTPWRSAEINVLRHWVDACAHEIAAAEQARPQRWTWRRMRRMALVLGVLAALGGALMMPMRLSVLAPAEVVARDPAVIRAPYGGIIDTVAVTPNQRVAKGDRLFALEARKLRTRLEVAERGLEVARAELRQARQGALGERKAETAIPVLEARVDKRAAEVAYVRDLLDRIRVTAPTDGVVLMPSKRNLTGRPVKLGERIMAVADPAAARLEIWIPTRDAIDFPDNAEVSLFLNTDPQTPRTATLARMAFEARKSPEGTLAFRALAAFAPEAARPRIGQRGTAKIHGREVRAYYALFRRPVSVLRQWLGI
jgi:biotin carboxyl carrier protein